MLIAAYGNIKSKPGNMLKGTTEETLDGINKDWFSKISRELGSGAFRFSPVRRVEIPKYNGGTRPLGVGNLREKIVQEAMRIVLYAIFASSFSPNSHGFVAGKSCHSALRQINLSFSGANWFLEGDLAKCFDTFDHRLLVRKVEVRIADQTFIDLLWKALRAGHIDSYRFIHKAQFGTPQGSLISPVLCNIYLTSLDVWMEDYIGSYIGTNKQAYPKYTKLIRGMGFKPIFERIKIRKFIHKIGYKSLMGSRQF